MLKGEFHYIVDDLHELAAWRWWTRLDERWRLEWSKPTEEAEK